MSRGINREEFKRLQMADAKPIEDEDTDSMDEDQVVVKDHHGQSKKD